jgi:hypothetical protein
MAPDDAYPRNLRPKEVDLLEGVLPSDRPGYRHYRALIDSMVVLAQGKRGPGNYILGQPGDVPDDVVSDAPVVAFGMVDTTRGTFTITVREYSGSQMDVEIVSASEEEVPDRFEEKRRWTYSAWRPGSPSPATGGVVREVPIDPDLTLAIAPQEKRVWVHDRASGMNLLVPVTNFHNELMLYKGIRDPKVALDIVQFFAGQNDYSDADLRETFIRYNALRPRVKIQAPPPVPSPKGFVHTLKRLFGKETR